MGLGADHHKGAIAVTGGYRVIAGYVGVIAHWLGPDSVVSGWQRCESIVAIRIGGGACSLQGRVDGIDFRVWNGDTSVTENLA